MIKITESQTAVHHLYSRDVKRTWEGGSDLLKADNGSTRTPDLWTPLRVDLREAICANKDFSASPQHASCKIPVALLTLHLNLKPKGLSQHSYQFPATAFNVGLDSPATWPSLSSFPSLLWNPGQCPYIYMFSFALLFLKHLPPNSSLLQGSWSLFLLRDTLPISSPWSLRCSSFGFPSCPEHLSRCSMIVYYFPVLARHCSWRDEPCLIPVWTLVHKTWHILGALKMLVN